MSAQHHSPFENRNRFMLPPANPSRPSIVVRETDAERLTALALNMVLTAPALANLLLDEIERAEVRRDDEVPADVVSMGSTVQFLEDGATEPRTVRLVYPAEVDQVGGRLSVFTPVGAGLLGLAPGQSILWPSGDGRRRSLKILRVSPTPVAICV